MGRISSSKGDYTFQGKEQAIDIIRNFLSDEREFWINGEKEYPCMAICVTDEYAAITYFQNENDEMWLSYNENNQEKVSFTAGGEEWNPDANVVIRERDMFLCVDEFLETNEKPTCIHWQEL